MRVKKITADPDRVLSRAQHCAIRLSFQVATMAKVLALLETLIQQGDQRLARRVANGEPGRTDVPENLALHALSLIHI